MDKPYDLADAAAVVTGASRGIGRATALELAARGAHVLVHCRTNHEHADRVAREIMGMGRESHVVVADLASRAGRSQLFDASLQWRALPRIWVNNAGVDVLTGDFAKEDWNTKLERLWHVDVMATLELTRAFVAAARQARPDPPVSIVNMGWDQAETGMAGDSGELFTTIKGAVMAFTRSVAKSAAPWARVNAVAPGWIKTEWGQLAGEYWQQRAQRESLLHRWGTPEDVARVIAWLSGPQAAFVNGQIILVNGGFRGSVDDENG